MTTHKKRTPGKGIARPPWSDPRAQVNRIAIFKITGFSAIGEAFGSVYGAGAPRKPRYWRVSVGARAEVAPEDRGITRPAHTFTEALALADEIRRRGDAFCRLERMMPSRLRPRPRHNHFERWPNGHTILGPAIDEIYT
ncbi:hypothetical protein [Nesterenkonia jeotgali]|uniref:Uncharacterized protein n=1 Tax=Nesterenkonia jeotgali TaxID=317018 RepID=A0A0W8ICX0_9MICC|nr:hypothetical protein [Nesterenkonia jeotgali]KUG57795.1 hypothetical protein AVL63_04530 [Nesterenkonia jeotgali]